MTDPKGNTTSYTYDGLNRLTQKVEPAGSATQYVYNQVGNRTDLMDARGNTINYAYDGNNRLITISYPDTTTVTFTYDENGNRTEMVDGLGTSTYSYDRLNRLTSYTDPFGKIVAYGYDANGNRTTLTYPDGKMVTYTYDALNRMTRVTDWVPNSTSYTYDMAGNLTGIVNLNNTRTSYTYDGTSRLVGLSNTKSDQTVISSYSYTLDSIGNQLEVSQEEPLQPVLTPKNIILTYDNENRLSSVGGVTFTYDSNGNMTGKGIETFVYDHDNRLLESNIGGVSSQYGYDGVGNRLVRTHGGTTKKYVLDINRKLPNVLVEADNIGTITVYYVYGLGLIAKILPDGTTYTYHYDSRGSTIALTGAAQTITDAYAYDSFGKVATSSGSTLNPFRYVGKYGVMEEGNGLNYVRARYYTPEIGRFVTKDLLTGDDKDGQSLNRYVYALNNPVIFIDANGRLVWVPILAAAGAIIGTAVSSGAYIAETLVLHQEEFDWRKLVGTAVGGALGGAITGGCASVGPLGAIACGSVSGLAGAVAEKATTDFLILATGGSIEFTNEDLYNIGLSTALGGVFGGVANAVLPGVSGTFPKYLKPAISGAHGQEIIEKQVVKKSIQIWFDKDRNIPYIPENAEAQSYKVRTFWK